MTERSLYNDTNINITTSRVILNTKENDIEEVITYAIRNITSVKMITTPSLAGCAIFIVIIGAFLLLLTLAALRGEDTEGVFGLFFFSALVIAGGLWWLFNCKPTYSVAIISSAGEKKALTSKDEAYIKKIVDSINDAIVSYQ